MVEPKFALSGMCIHIVTVRSTVQQDIISVGSPGMSNGLLNCQETLSILFRKFGQVRWRQGSYGTAGRILTTKVWIPAASASG